MKVCIYGPGAIGGWIALRLAKAGNDVSVVARGATAAALRAEGLTLMHEDGSPVEHATVRVATDPAELGVQDLVVLAVKAHALGQVAPHLAPLLGPETIVLTAMNGVPWWFLDGFGGAHEGKRLKSVDADGSIAAHLPGKHILGCVVQAVRALEGPGRIRQGASNKLTIGEPAGGKSPRALKVGALLEAAGIECVVSNQIQEETWFKLWGNMTTNPISAMTRATADRLMDDPLVLEFINKVMYEGKDIGARLGIVIDQVPDDRHAVTRKLGAFKTSMLQDAEAGRPLELDALVASVKELGEVTGVPTPYIDALLGLTRMHARSYGLY